MHAFATALQATRRRRNWRRAATVVLGGAAALAALPRPPPCSPPEFGTTWNGDTQIALREAQVPAPVIHTITQWVARWEQTGRAACDGYVVDPQQAQRRMECLHRARLQLSATVQTLAANAERAAMHGHLALSALGEPTECIGDRARRWGDGPDAFSGELAKARAWRALGEPQRARDALQTTVQQCRDAAQSYACAELHLALAEAESSSGKLDQAAAHLEEAWQAGESHDDPFIKAQASARLAHLEGVQRDRYDLGEQWARIATASIGRLFDPGDALMAYVEHARGRIAERRGDHSAALTHLERAIAHARRAPTYRLLGLPVALDAMGRALARAERIPEAVAAFEEAIEIRAGQLGGTHPRVALSRVGLASVLNLAGQLEEAGARFDAAIGDLERRLGEDHPLLAAPYNNRGRLHADAGRLELAAVDLERALRIRAAAPRTTTWALSRSHLNLAAVYAELGDAASAQPHLRAADELLPAASPERALWHEHRATLALQSGSWGAAQTELDRAEAMVATLPQRDPQRVSLALNRVLALQSAGRPDEARQNLGRIARTCEGRCEHALQQRLLKIGAGIPK